MKTVTIENRHVNMWLPDVDDHAWIEIKNLCSLPFLYHHLALMPDCHGGMGMPIGGVLATRNVVIPNAVGVDIGCGMCAVKTDIRVDTLSRDTLTNKIMSGIRQRIPLGFEGHNEPQDESLMPQGHDIEKMFVVKHQHHAARKQLGTLGGGNHFIELQRDEEGFMWVMLHSGSRNLGKRVCDHYHKIAEMLNERWHSVVPTSFSLAFLPLKTDEFNSYWSEMTFCIDYALCNRSLMMQRILEVIQDAYPNSHTEPMINIAHNYAAWEHHFGHNVIVHRKGAVRARKGEIGIIPGSMGTSSYIVEGLGCADSFMSSSHGAGRLMGRKEAIRTLNLEEEIRRMDEKGIIHGLRQQQDLDEAASAYKDIDEVLANQSDLVRIVTKLRPVAVIKG